MVNATAHGKSLAISPKQAIMVCQYLRGRKVARAKAILTAVMQQKEAIPFTRFNDGVGHRTGIAAAGRYPLKASAAILSLIKSAEANAIAKGLSGELVISELRANRASEPMRYGRQSRRQAKRAHVHVALSELATRKVTKDAKVTVESPAPAQSKAKASAPKTTEGKSDAKAKPTPKKSSQKESASTESTPKKSEKPMEAQHGN